ncbi:MAG TPA: hypothetical protein VFV58_12800, partial [Blastocatellia bacterium]|nr:hypothetical protein [Blastocatellia bacterium]
MAPRQRDARVFVIHAVEDDQPPPAIRFADVKLVFANADTELLALDGVSFDVPPGKITSVVGP